MNPVDQTDHHAVLCSLCRSDDVSYREHRQEAPLCEDCLLEWITRGRIPSLSPHWEGA